MLAELRPITSLSLDPSFYQRVLLNLALMAVASSIVVIFIGGFAASETVKGSERLISYAITSSFISLLIDILLLWSSPLFWAGVWVDGGQSLLAAMIRPSAWFSLWIMLLLGCAPVLIMYFFLTRFLLKIDYSTCLRVAAVISIITFIGWSMINPVLVQPPEAGRYRLVDAVVISPGCGGEIEFAVSDVYGSADTLWFWFLHTGSKRMLSPVDWRSIMIAGTAINSASGNVISKKSSPLLNRTQYNGQGWANLACRSHLDESEPDFLRKGEDVMILCSGLLPQPLDSLGMRDYWDSDNTTFTLSVSLIDCTVELSGWWLAAPE